MKYTLQINKVSDNLGVIVTLHGLDICNELSLHFTEDEIYREKLINAGFFSE